MNLNNLLDYLPELIATASAAFIGWLTGRRKNNAEIKMIENDAVAQIQQLYANLVKDTGERLQEQSRRITELEDTIINLKKVIEADKKLIRDLKLQIKKLTDKIK